MNKIEEMLKNEKVEWRKLGEVCEIKRGRVISKKYLEENQGDYPVYSSQTRNNGEIGRISTFDFDGEYITWTTDGAYAGTVFYRTGKFSITNICGLINPSKEFKIKFLYYWLQIEIKKYVTGGSGNPKLMSNVVSNIKIPIPSIKTQEKIVKILDKFTKYATELEKRIKQYNYYRDRLLSETYLEKITREMEEDRTLLLTTLGEIGEFTRGNGLQKKDFLDNGNPVIHYGQIYTKYGFYAEKVISYVSDEIFSKLKKAKKNDILIATTSENMEDVGKCVVWLGEEEIGFSGDMYSYRTNQNAKYIAYYFQTNEFQKIKERKVTGTKLSRIHGEDMSKIPIYLPSLDIQNKVVKILDKFQEVLEDTKGLLPQEIELRRKQYEYYREKLLTFSIEEGYALNNKQQTTNNKQQTTNNKQQIANKFFELLEEAAEIVGIKLSKAAVEWKTLIELTQKIDTVQWNSNVEKKYIDLSSVDVSNKKISLTELINKNNAPSRARQIVEYEDVIFGTTRPTQERFSIVPKELDNQICSTGYCVLRAIQKIVIPKWIYYNLYTTKFYTYIELNQKGASYPSISDSEVKKFKIMIPPLYVQEYVVSILDKFDTLVNDIKIGLPKEIELRQKQYEYYREKLLNFKK